MTLLAQVIGFGPAALGLPVAADRMGLLSVLSVEGLGFVDGQAGPEAMRGARFPYTVDSNSPAEDFLSNLDATGAFASVLDQSAAQTIHRQGRRPVPLRLVGEYLSDIADAITAWLTDGSGEVVYGRQIQRIRRNGDGTFTSFAADRRPVLHSRAVVLATGAREDLARLPPEFAAATQRIVTSGEVLAGRFRSAVAALEAGGQVAIVGASHSGFSVAQLLLRHCGDRVERGQITVVHRRIELAFDSLADMYRSPWRPSAPPVVCPDTGIVNRFRGLRNPARELCIAVLQGQERRIRLSEWGSDEATAAVRDSALLVYAAGYRSTAPDLVDDEDCPIPMLRHGRFVAVDASCRVLGHAGPIRDVYGVGIGFARPDSRGERRVGLNLFHGSDAEEILSGLIQPVTTFPKGSSDVQSSW
jgi:hypothetical protein